MAYFKLVNFNGIAPQVSPRLLGEGLGQTANNTDLDRGVLTPITSNSTVATLNAQARAGLYRYDFGGQVYNRVYQCCRCTTGTYRRRRF